MIVLVGPDGTSLPDAISRSLRGRPVTRVESVAAAEAAIAEGDDVVCVVLDVGGVPDAESLVRRVRAGEAGDPGLPFVLVDAVDVAALPLRPYDAVVAGDAPAVAALDRALRVGEYRAAVAGLYEECRARAAGGEASTDETLRAARDDADRKLAALADDPTLVSALLGNPDGRGEG